MLQKLDEVLELLENIGWFLGRSHCSPLSSGLPACAAFYSNLAGCPVEDSTERHTSLSGRNCFFPAMASGMGTWMKVLDQSPIRTSVLPAIAACTALRASRSHN